MGIYLHSSVSEVSTQGRTKSYRDTPQHSQSDIVRSEAFPNAFRSFEAGIMFFFTRLMFSSSTSASRL